MQLQQTTEAHHNVFFSINWPDSELKLKKLILLTTLSNFPHYLYKTLIQLPHALTRNLEQIDTHEQLTKTTIQIRPAYFQT
jgi:hypothetical protein